MQDSPQHVAIIMDGNGRWAKARGLPRTAGHRAGLKVVRQIVEECVARKVGFLTLFTFSSENWRRPPDEVGMLMGLVLDALEREINDLHRNGVRLRFIGDRAMLGADLTARILSAEALTLENKGLGLNVAMAYGGRWDISQACRSLASEVASGALQVDEINEARIGSRLSLAPLPDPDLMIRTGGEQRISNFLLWNMAYTELYFCDVLWPEFSVQNLQNAFDNFKDRERRFGKTSLQITSPPNG